MDQIKKIFLFSIPVSICNFRCHYCYLAQRDASFQGVHPEMKYTPDEFRRAMNIKRVGGPAFANFCADGETLLVKNIDQYVKCFIEEGHYAEVVTNLSITPVLDKFLSWDKDLLNHLEFKCSFHYLELKKKGMLETFAQNVKKIWAAGASANIEITPTDELIPYIDEVVAFSMEHFGALPHLTIARNDKTSSIEYLTELDPETYSKIWSQFDSDFWAYKRSIFGKKQKRFCYAGAWSMYVNLCTGDSQACYCGESLGDVFFDPSKPFPEKPVIKCTLPHCYNGHALLTLGLIPYSTNTRYGDIRNRVRSDHTEWLQPELKAFLNTQLISSNKEYSSFKRSVKRCSAALNKQNMYKLKILPNRVLLRVLGDKKYSQLKQKIRK